MELTSLPSQVVEDKKVFVGYYLPKNLAALIADVLYVCKAIAYFQGKLLFALCKLKKFVVKDISDFAKVATYLILKG